MINVILVIHIMIAIALVVVVLMQRSEGGALGMGGGGGGGGGGFLTGRGTANLLTRTTAILAVCFFVTSIALTLLANSGSRSGSVFDNVGKPAATDSKGGESGAQPSPPADGGGGLLEDLERGRAPLPSVPGTR